MKFPIVLAALAVLALGACAHPPAGPHAGEGHACPCKMKDHEKTGHREGKDCPCQMHGRMHGEEKPAPQAEGHKHD